MAHQAVRLSVLLLIDRFTLQAAIAGHAGAEFLYIRLEASITLSQAPWSLSRPCWQQWMRELCQTQAILRLPTMSTIRSWLACSKAYWRPT